MEHLENTKKSSSNRNLLNKLKVQNLFKGRGIEVIQMEKTHFNQIVSRILFQFSHFSSVAQSCPTLCDPMNCSTPALPVHHQLPEFTQTHVHQVSDAIQPSHPLLSPSPPAPNPSQHQSFPMSQLFAWWPKYWSFSFSIR